jgi:MFS family permease
MLDIAVVNTALSAIAADLHTGLHGLQWVVDAYTLALATVVLTAGSLADRFGRRRVFGIGLVVFTAMSAPARWLLTARRSAPRSRSGPRSAAR